MTDVLVLEDLTIRTAERRLVEGVSLRLARGGVTALVGPSGSGKSLCARAAMGVIDVRPGLERGSLWLPGLVDGDLYAGVAGGGEASHGRLFRSMRPLRGQAMTYAPQAAATALNPGRTIGWQLAVAVRRRLEPPPSEGVAVRALLRRVGLENTVAAALPRELSGGMAQRAALAVALAPRPTVLIADEPETGLDPVTRRTIVELLRSVAAEQNVALWLISHSRETVGRIATNVVDLGPA